MADLQLKRIQIRNWMTVRSADITFPEKGLVLVLGSNLAAHGKLQSVGSGKTGLGEALSCALVGAQGRFSHTIHYIPDDQTGNTYVKVEAQLLSKPLVVELGVRCPELSKTGEALRFTYGDATPIQRKTPDQTRDELCRTLRVTPELANWTVFIDGDRLKFNRMSQEDTVDLLMTALGQPPWTVYFERVKKKLDLANKQLALSRQALDSAKRTLEVGQEDLEEAEASYRDEQASYDRQVEELAETVKMLKANNSADRGSITGAEAEKKRIKKKLKELEDKNAEANHQLEIKRQELRDQFAIIDEEWLSAADAQRAKQAELDQASDTLRKMQRVPKNCPTCSKPWDKGHSEEEIAKATKVVVDLEQALLDAQTKFTAANRKRKQVNQSIAEIEDNMKKVGETEETIDLADLYEKNEKLVINLNATIHARELKLAALEQGIDKSFVNKRLAVVEERKRAIQRAIKAIETAASEVAMDEEVVKIIQYWYRAYGPTGIPNMVLSDSIAPLNRAAQRISNLMTGGTLQVSYSTTKELAKGTVSRLVTKVENRIGSKRLEGSSKGESGLTNLIIAENLSEVGQVSSRVGFRWYDEITNGQDSMVRRSIFAYLKEVAHRLGILVFVVDHHTEAASYADYILVAEKSVAQGTCYYWA
jgi:DNA repair exonuclease SbcCD ATPase subunit